MPAGRWIAWTGLLAATSCASFAPVVAPEDEGGASEATRRARAPFAALPLDDPTDFEDALRGRIASESDVVVEAPDGTAVWDTNAYAFLGPEQAPETVNPSLWRQARLDAIHGLFEVTEGVYQVRGYDLSNMTIIEGETGRIVVDPLTSRETAVAAFRLVERTLGARPITAVVFTHSHVDHFGGVQAVVGAYEIAAGGVRIVAPEGFLEAATGENTIAGVAMRRRADLMYGRRLPRGPRGHVDSGLGPSPASGTVGLAVPTDRVGATPTELEIDGVRFVFQYAPGSEATAELTFYLPEKKAFCGADLVSHSMQNLYPPRGAPVRDALRWSDSIDDAIRLFGGQMEVLFASHHWPTWGNAQIVPYLEKQRDTYRYIHDQTVRLANAGATPREIAEQLELPASLAGSFASRGYDGTLRLNAKAVYQWYLGWYDGNPANLDPLPPREEGQRYLALLGGPSAVLAKARASFAEGDYRWTATLLDHLVFARPDDAEARELLARTYEQLGYRAESGPWRDIYLSGADELRNGEPRGDADRGNTPRWLGQAPLDRLFEVLATRLDGPAAEGVDLSVNFVFTDTGESYHLWIQNAVLHHHRGDPDPKAAATAHVTKTFLVRMAAGQAAAREAIFSDELEVEGSRAELWRLWSLLETPDPSFAIVRP